MINLAHSLNYATMTLTVGLTSVGVALGQGLAGAGAIKAINKQPSVRNDITKTVIIGMALMETAAVVSVAIGILLLFDPTIKSEALYPSIARFGIVAALCLSGFTIGIVSSMPTIKACEALARQPFFTQKIVNLLLITQSVVQTPILFSFIIAWFIKVQAPQATTLVDSLRLLASGLVIGCGSIGPAIGLASFAKVALEGIGINRKCYPKMLTFTFLSEALIETPILFSFVVALFMLFTQTGPQDPFVRGVILISAAVSTGLGTLVPGIKSGHIAQAAGKQLALHPEHYTALSRASMFAQALMDTFVIYAALVSLLMLILTK